MVEIIINDDKCRIVGNMMKLILDKLDEELSFKVLGAQFIKSYNWDGVIRLLEPDLSFKYGLLDRVCAFLKRYDVEFTIKDNRIKLKNNKIDISDNLKELEKNPRYYQIEASEKVLEKDIGIFRMATGSGKTLTMALMISSIGKKTVVYVISKDLLYQVHEFFEKVFKTKIGIIGDGHCRIEDINVASVWTVGQVFGVKQALIDDEDDEKELEKNKYAQIKKLLLEAKVHIFDECHIASCSTIQEIGKNIKAENIYGMSASPIRDDNSDLLIECVLGKVIYNLSASDLIERGYLTQPIIRFVNVPKIEDNVTDYRAIYKRYIIDNDVRNNIVIEKTVNLINLGYVPLVLYKSIRHGKIIQKLLSKHVPCMLLSGNDDIKIREKAKADLESGKIKAIIASNIFDIGLDLPILSGLVIAGGGKSSVRALQRIGRVIRPYKNKKWAAVIDFYDNIKYLKDHSKRRKQIYSSEKGFIVKD
jgi:superfamily II DNA or RNA helicase